jgi:putative ABC transport system substrate-binding protein
MKFRVIVSCLVLLLASTTVRAQEAKIPRIGYIMDRGPTLFDDAFLVGLREHGWVVGQNIAIDYRWSEGKSEQLPALAADLVARQVDVIVTAGTTTKVVKSVTARVPIVMASSQNPVVDGLVASLAHPGGNVTGRSGYVTELTPKRIELLKQVVPGLSRIAILWNTRNTTGTTQAQEAEVAGRALGLTIDSIDVRIPDGLDSAVARAAEAGAGAILVLSDTATITHSSHIAAAVQRHRLPTMFANKGYLAGGGLMSYGPDLAETYRLSAAYVDKILRGAKPGDLPVTQPTQFELAINLRAAKAIGLEIPQAVLAFANEVIE